MGDSAGDDVRGGGGMSLSTGLEPSTMGLGLTRLADGPVGAEGGFTGSEKEELLLDSVKSFETSGLCYKNYDVVITMLHTTLKERSAIPMPQIYVKTL